MCGIAKPGSFGKRGALVERFNSLLGWGLRCQRTAGDGVFVSSGIATCAKYKRRPSRRYAFRQHLHDEDALSESARIGGGGRTSQEQSIECDNEGQWVDSMRAAAPGSSGIFG